MLDWLTSTIRSIPANFWGVLIDMAPYLLFGFLVAGVLAVLLSPELVERHLGGRGLWPILKASAFGVPLPLCSCGVIPVAAGLRRHGASREATTAFLISTPQTGVDSILVTYALLGPAYAIFRPIAALVSGVVGGIAVAVGTKPRGGKAFERAAEKLPCTDACCDPLTELRGGKLKRMLHYGFVDLPRDIGPSLLVGLLIAALISAVVKPGALAPYLGSGILAMLVMMAAGVPIYVCATASVPIAAVLIEAGVSPGAALVFLMTGPATNAATITTIWKLMGRRTAIIYVATVMVTALVAGLTMDGVFRAVDVRPVAAGHEMLPLWLRHASAVGLLGLLGWAAVSRKIRKSRPPGAQAEVVDGAAAPTSRLAITGMTCSHCAGAVERALAACQGVTSVRVDLGAGQATVGGDDLDTGELIWAVEQAGYHAAPADAN